MKANRSRKQKINIVTLGCSKNVVDSEKLARQLEMNGVDILHNAETSEAQTVIVNTCGFIRDSKDESIQSILGFIKARKDGLLNHVYVMGCLSERYKPELEKEIGEVDQYFGVNSLEEIVRTLGYDYKKNLLGERQLSTPGHYAYLKISEGCDRSCAFCAIPLIRGKHVSIPAEELVKEASFLARKGVKELILIAQDLTYYGRDTHKKSMLASLLRSLAGINGIEWIRLHYAYPASFPREVIQFMKEEPKICRYIDIPFQHISDPMLQKMRRNINKAETYDLIQYIREELPGVALRTTLMVGHPGETAKDFGELCEFVEKSRFERLGTFSYSHEEDTFGWKNYKNNVPESVKKSRLEKLMRIQQEISNDLNNKKIGSLLKVLVDRREGDFYIARSESDSPEVDNEILIPVHTGTFMPGTFVQVRIIDATEFDLTAMPV